MTSTTTQPDFNYPRRGTASAAAYFRAVHEDLMLIASIVENASALDAIQARIRAYDEGLDTPSPKHATKENERRISRSQVQQLLQMFLARDVDNFEKYVIDVLREVLRAKPSILKSSQPTLSLEYVLGFDSFVNFTNDVIEKKVTALSYEGFNSLQEWCDSRGVTISIARAAVADVVEVVATRNIIIHNRGRVDERYLKAAPTSAFAVGDLRRLTTQYVFDRKQLLLESVVETDKQLAAKFVLSQIDIDLPSSANASQRP